MATIARNRALDEVRRVRPVSLEDMPEGFEPAAEEVDHVGGCGTPEKGAVCPRRGGILNPDRASIPTADESQLTGVGCTCS